MADAPEHGPTPPEPGELTVGLAAAGVRPRQMTAEEWAAMHTASAGYHGRVERVPFAHAAYKLGVTAWWMGGCRGPCPLPSD